MFEWWNHWPVTQVASSGISAVAPDRASHSSLSHLLWEPTAKSSNSITKIMLAGMTTEAATGLLPLARSWLSAPEAMVDGAGFASQGYDEGQRAFVFTRVTPPAAGSLHVLLHASTDQPLVNPAFVVKNWGREAPKFTVEGRPVDRGATLRYGFVSHPEGDDLVIWMQLTSVVPVRLEVGSLSHG